MLGLGIILRVVLLLGWALDQYWGRVHLVLFLPLLLWPTHWPFCFLSFYSVFRSTGMWLGQFLSLGLLLSLWIFICKQFLCILWLPIYMGFLLGHIRWSLECGSSIFTAQQIPASSPNWQVRFFDSILSTVFHSSFSPYHRLLPILTSPFVSMTFELSKNIIVLGGGGLSCGSGLVIGM